MQNLVEHINIVIFGLAVVFAWGALRASGVRDDEGRRLPPSVFSGVYLGLFYLGLYLGLLLLAYSSPAIMEDDGWISLIPFAKSLVQEGQLPLLMLILLYGVHSIPQIKDLERVLVIRMHAVNDRGAEQRELRNYFVRCGYQPSPEAAERHMEFLRQFDLHLTDREPTQLGLGASNSWGKVSSILEILYEHMSETDSTFSTDEKEQIRRLDQAHRRKTELATNLFRMAQQLDEQPAYDTRLGQVAGVLGEASHEDRASVAAAETFAAEILRTNEQERAATSDEPTDAAPSAPATRISASELRRYAGAVERYFSAEYELLLEEASALGAKAIARAGDSCDEKMAELKAAGFNELGSMQQINIDRLMIVVLVALIAPLASYYLIGEYTGVGTTRATILVTVALTLAVAVFVAAISGTRRTLAQASETPWRSYFTAGVIAMMCAVAIFGGRQALRESERQEELRQKVLEIMAPSGDWRSLSDAAQQAMFERRSPAIEEQATQLIQSARRRSRRESGEERASKSQAATHFQQCRDEVRAQRDAQRSAQPGATQSRSFWATALPWSLGALVVVVVMCRLIRQPEWGVVRGSVVAERLIDGAILGCAYGVAALASLKIAAASGSFFGMMIDCTYANGFFDVPGILFARSALIGLVIGAVVIRDLRIVANARVIEPYVSRRGRRLATPAATI